MNLVYRFLFPALWLSWTAYWFIAARGVKTAERRETRGSRLLHTIPLLVAAWLLWSYRFPFELLRARVFAWAPWMFWLGASLTTAGLLFTVWARVHIGRNWSGTVTIKRDHEFVASGPYSLVRHPIYSGLLLGFLGSAVARDEWRGILAFVMVWLALWRKYRLEERWMIEQFGTQYQAYRQRVPALVPFAKAFQRGAKDPD